MVTPDATLAAFYPAGGIAHVGRIRRSRRIRQPLQITAYGKNRYTTYTNARHSRRNLYMLYNDFF
ncbi:hypothetical protein AAIH68_35295, partial [Pseudomonas aeruginosa]|uniref:hypothetical protein n=1 Tax=Pseudomonas aeruginosa TaxID=287 RepID=UPI0031B7076A